MLGVFGKVNRILKPDDTSAGDKEKALKPGSSRDVNDPSDPRKDKESANDVEKTVKLLEELSNEK